MAMGMLISNRKPGSIAAIVDVPDAFVPIAYALAPIRPNPFSSRTTITLDLPRAGRVNLSIYDVTGRLMATLANEPKTAGRFDVVWDGRGPEGLAPAGIYFVRMRSGDFSATRKLVLLR